MRAPLSAKEIAAGALGVTLVLLSLARAGRAAETTEGSRLGEFSARRFGVADGLPRSEVLSIVQGGDRFLWIGTKGGLARFDGTTFTPIEGSADVRIAGHTVAALAPEPGGALWIGLNGGAGLVRLAEGRFTSFFEALGATSPRNAVLTMAGTPPGELWLGGWTGVGKVQEGRIVRAVPEPLREAGAMSGVWASARANDGAIWLGTLDGRIVRIAAGQVAIHGVAAGLPGEAVLSLAPDDDGSVWAGTDLGGIVRLRAGRVDLRVKSAPPPAARRVNALLRDHAGQLWAGTAAGLGRVRGDALELFGAAEGLPAAEVLALAEDAERNLWVGGRAGLVRLGRGAGKTIRLPAAIAPESATALVGTSAGELWIGVRPGHLVVWREGRLTTYGAADGLCADVVHALAEGERGTVWVGGTRRGDGALCRFQDGRFTALTTPALAGAPIRAVMPAGDGSVWVGGRQLVRLAAGVAEPISLPVTGPVTALARAPDGALWVGTVSGLVRREPGGATRRWRWQEGLPSNLVSSIHFARDEVWVGTAQGLGRIRGGQARGYDRARGLFDDPVLAALEDAAGRLWLCTPGGIFRTSVDAVDAYERGGRGPIAHERFGAGAELFRCGADEGGATAWVAPSGAIWFLGGPGAVQIDESSLRPSHEAPPAVFIERVLADGRSHSPTERAPLRIPAGRRDLRIDFTAPRFTAPERVHFRYRLIPFDAGWVDAGSRRSAFYTNLPPGDHRFEVSARDGEGPFGAATGLSLGLAPHFHQTLAFRVGCALLALLAAVGLHRFRVRRLRKRHALVLEERGRLARDLHDTMAQGFAGIALQIEAAQRQLVTPSSEAAEHLERARRLARTSLEDAREVVWALRQESLAGGLGPALTRLAGTLGPKVASVAIEGAPRSLPAFVEAALFRIAQEALTNALRHARPNRVAMRLAYGPTTVVLEVEDDGCGFDVDAAPPAGHFGIVGLRERAALIGGTLTLKRRPTGGTCVRMEVSVP